MQPAERTARATHVLVDLDGTLSDSHLGIVSSLREAFVGQGIADPGDDQLLLLIGPPFEDALPALGLTSAQVDAVIGSYRSRYDVTGLFETAMYPGIDTMLDELCAAGLTLAVATSKPEGTASRVVEHLGIGHHFATVAGASTAHAGDGVRRTKAAVIAEALERLGVDAADAPRSVVMLGDRRFDVEGARVHGLACVGAAWGYGGADELADAGARAVCARPADVPAAIAALDLAG